MWAITISIVKYIHATSKFIDIINTESDKLPLTELKTIDPNLGDIHKFTLKAFYQRR